MNPGELIGELVRLVGDVIGASSLRLGPGPTLAILGVLLVFLQLVARPVSRWSTRDAGGLGGIGRAMALAAEAGSATVLSLGTAGLSRSTHALGRLQTLAAVALLGHVGRAAARAGVPLNVRVADPISSVVAEAALETAHERTATAERSGRSRVTYDGDGRGVAAGLVRASAARPFASVAVGGFGEEAQLLLGGLSDGAGSTTFGTADAAQAGAVLLSGDETLIGTEPFAAPADLRATTAERGAVIAGDRLITLVILGLVLATALALAGIVDLRGFLAGTA
jgi:hypothetical protein